MAVVATAPCLVGRVVEMEVVLARPRAGMVAARVDQEAKVVAVPVWAGMAAAVRVTQGREPAVGAAGDRPARRPQPTAVARAFLHRGSAPALAAARLQPARRQWPRKRRGQTMASHGATSTGAVLRPQSCWSRFSTCTERVSPKFHAPVACARISEREIPLPSATHKRRANHDWIRISQFRRAGVLARPPEEVRRDANAAAPARGVGHGTSVHGVNSIRPRRRNGGGRGHGRKKQKEERGLQGRPPHGGSRGAP